MTEQASEMMDDDAQREASRQSHLDWLRTQHSDFEAHKARSSQGMLGDDPFAGGGQQIDDDFPVYRSLSVAGPSEPAHEFEEEPVYRSMDLSKMVVSENLPSPDRPVGGDPSSSWVAAKRPPLLRRQNAFAFNSEDPSWLNILDANGHESG
uniref:Uncharacterized protein n=1 Tax=Haptolina brevifila TaxID=156173 RepID=A0A7S2FQD3_9EUKA|mmetsp:Transcript_16114/g.32294  ORF Transcript_16114/g.32294 Transcript_16114/m.32294 type:complete len:151 (+) Transcript_16114:73-525(+)|eukprot:CAMPEP_0174715232 /NCGR_PEP_ID=MMETSP1094-20130205/20861_1 /TAXON_ID=156173 /ORGANISM="Chrysochromulina brevifilum, Strain UTEX LB 985" /LENGTH=150 /DNA_ID=CAMNT_0015914767 /DNA_START=72 /DNA_END=524 /DNA_ORIENTATION=+